MLLNRRFGPKIRNTELAAIKNLRQTSSVDNYEEQFLLLVCRCEGLTEAHQVELFLAGLHKSIRTDVKLMYPVTLEHAMDHARAYEEHDTPEDTDTRYNSCVQRELLWRCQTVYSRTCGSSQGYSGVAK
jgi:hypothetical protein